MYSKNAHKKQGKMPAAYRGHGLTVQLNRLWGDWLFALVGGGGVKLENWK